MPAKPAPLLRTSRKITRTVKCLGSLFDGMQAGAVLFSHLFDGKNFSAQGGKLGKLLLNCF